MKFTLRLREPARYESRKWHESAVFKDVQFAIRRTSLAQRIELTQKARELSVKHEFLRAGEPENQVEAALSELLVRRVYLEWGLVELRGLMIDGEQATVESLIEKGPEPLSDEIIGRIKAEIELSEEERKNF